MIASAPYKRGNEKHQGSASSESSAANVRIVVTTVTGRHTECELVEAASVPATLSFCTFQKRNISHVLGDPCDPSFVPTLPIGGLTC